MIFKTGNITDVFSPAEYWSIPFNCFCSIRDDLINQLSDPEHYIPEMIRST